MPDTILEGGCLCGKARYRVNGPPRVSEYCHCGMCRKAAGAPVVVWADYPVANFRWTTDAPAEYPSSPEALRGFCATCGSSLTFRLREGADWISIAVGSLDHPDAVQPMQHIYDADRIHWLHLEDGLPRHAAHPKKP